MRYGRQWMKRVGCLVVVALAACAPEPLEGESDEIGPYDIFVPAPTDTDSGMAAQTEVSPMDALAGRGPVGPYTDSGDRADALANSLPWATAPGRAHRAEGLDDYHPTVNELTTALMVVDEELVLDGEAAGVCACNTNECLQEAVDTMGCGYCLSVICGDHSVHICTQACAPRGPQSPLERGDFGLD